MAGQNVRILGPQQLTDVAATLYVAPFDVVTLIQHIHVSNPSNLSCGFTMALGVDNVLNRIYDLYTIGAGQALDVFCKYVMVGGDIIQTWAARPNVLNITINGAKVPAPVVPQLQPFKASMAAAWSLDTNVDRSGHGMDLTAGQGGFCGDLIKGSRGSFGTLHGLQAANDAALRFTGEITVTGRVWTGAGDGFIAGMVKAENERQCWSIIREPKLAYRVETPVAASFTPAGVEFTIGSAWTFIAMRRTAAGVVTLNVDGNQVVSGALPAPTFSSGNAFRVGGQVASIAGGGIADLAIFAEFMTDTEIQARRRVMMGLP